MVQHCFVLRKRGDELNSICFGRTLDRPLLRFDRSSSSAYRPWLWYMFAMLAYAQRQAGIGAHRRQPSVRRQSPCLHVPAIPKRRHEANHKHGRLEQNEVASCLSTIFCSITREQIRVAPPFF